MTENNNNNKPHKEPSAIRKCANKMKCMPVIGKIFEPKPKVAVLRMSGVIADQSRKNNISYSKYAPLIEKAFGMADIEEVALVINSPGGAPAQCSLISSMIRGLAEEKNIKVTAFVEDVAASGGYWLACAADEIYVQESSIIGSIGVIAAMFGFDKTIKRYDVERRVYTEGEHKSFMDPFQPEDEQAVKRLKAMQKAIHKNFIEWVKSRRGEKLKGTDKSLFEGQIWVGKDGIDHGIADAVGDVWSVMRGRYGKKVKLATIEPDKPFWTSFIPGAKISMPDADDVITAIEDKAVWNRWGL
jgi:serine protease SohB